MLNLCFVLRQTSSGAAQYPVLTTTASPSYGIRHNESTDLPRAPPDVSKVAALVVMTSGSSEYPTCRSCLLLNIWKDGATDECVHTSLGQTSTVTSVS